MLLLASRKYAWRLEAILAVLKPENFLPIGYIATSTDTAGGRQRENVRQASVPFDFERSCLRVEGLPE